MGSAELGGGYSSASRGFSALEVANGSGRVQAGTDATGWAWLDAPSVRDVDVTVQITAADRGSGSVSAGPVVRASDKGMYSVRLEASGESVALVVDLVSTGADSDTRLVGPIGLPVEAPTAGRPVIIRVQATGSDPTSIRVRAWVVGQPEPHEWPVELVDWTGRLQHAAGVGVAWIVTGLPAGGVDIQFDDLLAQSIDPQAVR